MKSLLLAACLLALPAATAVAQTAPPAPADYTQADAKRDIGKVIEDFRTAIIEKDKARFLGLFLKDSPVVWQDVVDDANLHERRKNKPDAKKLRVDLADGPVSFIEGIVSESGRSEETFDNIRIETDGDVASVFFDYRFLSDGSETNRGKEAWHMVRGDDGWKIVSVIWSMNWRIKTPG